MSTLHQHSIKNRIFSVSELTSQIKELLEDKFPIIWINGEISNFSRPASGHVYFSLKDTAAQISAVMFRGQNQRLTFELEDGMQITGMGRLSVYEPRGRYQIIFEHIEPKGIGALQVAFEQLKARLAAEGLFDDSMKHPIPFLPAKIAVITSPTGAVVHDIINIISRRYPTIDILIVPTKVQGHDAETSIAAAFDRLAHRQDVDVIILARGGGSLEDLQAFNSETVARAISAATVPVISAVGHETDYTIADFVADLRAPTPSAAAELVVPDKNELRRRHETLSERLIGTVYGRIDRYRDKTVSLRRRLKDPRKTLQDFRLRLDDNCNRIGRAMSRFVEKKRDTLKLSIHRLNAENPKDRLQRAVIDHRRLHTTMQKHILATVTTRRRTLNRLARHLDALNPAAILERGYSITRTLPFHDVVTDPDAVSVGTDVEVLLAKGGLTCEIKGKLSHGEKND